MSCIITKRDVGDVTILECSGRLTLGEGSALLRETIKGQVEIGRNQLVLLLAEIAYMDSSGVGELVSGFTTVYNSGGALKLLSPKKRIVDFLQITKLYTVFDVYQDEAAAVRSFGGPSYPFQCPVCQNRVLAYIRKGCDETSHTCGRCDGAFTLSDIDPVAGRAAVRALSVPSYARETLTLRCGAPFELIFLGRLTLFSSRALKKLWAVVPGPRRLLVDMSGMTECDDAGRDALLSLLSGAGSPAKVAVSLNGLPNGVRAGFPTQPPFFEDRDVALNWLGNVSDTPQLSIALLKY
ncbi:STAS domain-containing protein [Paludibaculum fermentans]|uniref:STAS domain-containing protein n=1 Tax=Paludibaculum fermentans TaxID=1473598 RepID=UPI003EBF1BA4